ncbi:hypothetical protein BKA64DRAFT_707328 [Cadophora sp. MPI-SDFR-AT-0126]|nr:hypothetical protein BKA64DRAFT_707328 [Leotiomycetes sp. MPI-SDFR-AT-0126]
MFSTEIRDQLLSNLKALYGDKVEILTLYIDTGECSGHQAIAITSQSPKATWTKLLHGQLNSQTEFALRDLLLESEKELAKLLATNGNNLPFRGEMTQVLTNDSGQQVSDSPASHESDFVVLAAPVSSLSDLQTNQQPPSTLDCPVDEMYPKDSVCEELVCKEPICDEPACEAPACEVSICEEPVHDETVYVVDAIDEPQPVPDKYYGWGSFAAKKEKRGKKRGKKVDEEVRILESIPEPEPDYNDAVYRANAIVEPQPVPSEADEWGWFIPKTGKRGKSKGKKAVEEVEIPEEPPAEPEPLLPAACTPVPETAVEQDSWFTQGMSPKNEKDEEMRSIVPSDGAVTQTGQEEPEMRLEVKQLASPLATASPIPTAPRSGQAVVFTIRHFNNMNKTDTREVMLFLTDTTYAAICEAVFLYLDSQEGVLPSKRGLQLKAGTGRNGKVDLSAIEESMCPVYMEYFCQYTKLPELTVDVLDSSWSV